MGLPNYTRKDLDAARDAQILALEHAREVTGQYRAGKASDAERKAAMAALEKADERLWEVRWVVGQRNIAEARRILEGA